MLVRLVTNAAGETGAGFQASYQAVCKAGFTMDSVSMQCVPCPLGSYAPFAAMESCTPCPIGFYAAAEGVAQCTACPAYATTTSSGSYLLQSCMCQPGYYGWDNACRVCPEGATCPGGNLVMARAGWCALSTPANVSAATPLDSIAAGRGGAASLAAHLAAAAAFISCALRLAASRLTSIFSA
jgi:hypothetical protein